MVGRGAELELLVGELATAATGAGRCALIEGEPGIGKTRLIAEALETSRDLGLTVLNMEVDEFEYDRPFGPLLRAFPLPNALPSPRGGERTWRIVDAVVDAVEQSAARRPLVLIIEDVQWADAPTLRTLQVLARRMSSLPAALVLTRRLSPTTTQVDAVVRTVMGAGGRRILLGPLEPSDVSELALAALGTTATADALAYLDQAAGNPFLVTGLVEAVVSGDGKVPPAAHDVQDAYLARLGAVGSGPRWLARTASVLGNRFSVAELAAVAGATSAQLLSPLEELVANGFLARGRWGLRVQARPHPRRAVRHDPASRPPGDAPRCGGDPDPARRARRRGGSSPRRGRGAR